ATASTYGAGCYGSVGPVQLVATRAPWLGGIYEVRGTGIAANAVTFDLLGFTATNLPLSIVHRAAGAGCRLLVSLDVTRFLPANAGAVRAQLPIPNVPTLVGVTLREQILQVEIDPVLGITALSSSN